MGVHFTPMITNGWGHECGLERGLSYLYPASPPGLQPSVVFHTSTLCDFVDFGWSSVVSHPRMVKASGIFTTTGRIIFYNRWKDNFGKLQVYCTEFHEWLIHLNRKHGCFLLPLQFSTGPSKLFKFFKMWSLYHPWVDGVGPFTPLITNCWGHECGLERALTSSWKKHGG